MAGVTNTDVVLDPSGFLTTGPVVRIPFLLTEADIESTVILLTDIPAIDMVLETPAGQHITSANAAALSVGFLQVNNLEYYRYGLPVPIGAGAAAGTWHVLLTLNDTRFARYCGGRDRDTAHLQRRCAHNGVRYSVSAQVWSNLRMRAILTQDSLEPGATMTLRATLDEYGVPVEQRAGVRAEITRPDGSNAVVSLTELDPGIFESSVKAVLPGVYRFRVVASGVTMRGAPFTREQTLTGATFLGGDQPLPQGGEDRGSDFCCLVRCLLDDASVRRYLAERGIDAQRLAGCVEKCCR